MDVGRRRLIKRIYLLFHIIVLSFYLYFHFVYIDVKYERVSGVDLIVLNENHIERIEANIKSLTNNQVDCSELAVRNEEVLDFYFFNHIREFYISYEIVGVDDWYKPIYHPIVFINHIVSYIDIILYGFVYLVLSVIGFFLIRNRKKWKK